MKNVFFAVLALVVSTPAFAASYRGVVGFRQVPGSMTVLNGGNSVTVRADGSSCTMKFGPVIGRHDVGGSFGRVYANGYVLAVQQGCGERIGDAILYINKNGGVTLNNKFGRSGSYLFR